MIPSSVQLSHLVHQKDLLRSGAVEEDEADVAGKGADLGGPVLPVSHQLVVVVPKSGFISAKNLVGLGHGASFCKK